MTTINICLAIGLSVTVGMIIFIIIDRNRVRRGKDSFIFEEEEDDNND